MSTIQSMACEVCHRGPADGVTVFRQNAKGQPGIFRCEEHTKPVDADLYRDVSLIESRDSGRSKQ